jgi:adenylate cyclase
MRAERHCAAVSRIAPASNFPYWRSCAEGVTDYLALPLVFSDGAIHVATWTTRRQGGFDDREIAALESLGPPLARLAETHALRRNAANLLDSYVGHQSGERILAGHIERGDCEELDAAIWLSDMRGFTTLADNLPPPTLLALLFTPPRISAASPCPCWSPRCG